MKLEGEGRVFPEARPWKEAVLLEGEGVGRNGSQKDKSPEVALVTE